MISDGKGVHVGGGKAVGARDVPNLHSSLRKTPPALPFLEFGDGVPGASHAEAETKGEHVTLPIPMGVRCLTHQPHSPHVHLAQGGQALGVYLVHER